VLFGKRFSNRLPGSPVADEGRMQAIVILLAPTGPIRRRLEVGREYRITPHQLFELLINVLLPIWRNSWQAAIIGVAIAHRRDALQHPTAGGSAIEVGPTGL
jgi:hypothetical protein